jgi:hypothetical protein
VSTSTKFARAAGAEHDGVLGEQAAGTRFENDVTGDRDYRGGGRVDRGQ